ncbi:unnamed protein product [marine sediment metagenome]|uniref:Uncharacterized protein n=1 Tax=marine sediment metagenome TaxID=412755 RepID=X0YL58_9ZZZZ
MVLYTILCIFVAWQITALVDNIITATTFQFYFWVVCASILKTNKLIGLKVQTI